MNLSHCQVRGFHISFYDSSYSSNQTLNWFNYVACPNGTAVVLDADSDGLADYWEDRNGDGSASGEATSWTNAVTNPSPYGYNDLQWLEAGRNILVNDPGQDYANEQNTQWQPGVVVLGDTVIVGYWDSNQGVYELGQDKFSTSDFPLRMVAYSVSTDGGRTFADMGVALRPDPLRHLLAPPNEPSSMKRRVSTDSEGAYCPAAIRQGWIFLR